MRGITTLPSLILVFLALLIADLAPAANATMDLWAGPTAAQPPDLTSRRLAAATDLQELSVVGHAGGTLTSAAVEGNYAYVVTGAELAAVDISDPQRPRRVGFTLISRSIWGIKAAGGYLYIANFRHGLRVIDAHDPTDMHEVAAFVPTGSAYNLAVSGGYVYLATDLSGLVIVDVRDPRHPVEKGRYSPPQQISSMGVVGHYLYLGSDGDANQNPGGFAIVDVADPAHPKAVGGFYGADTWGIAVANGFLYAAWINQLHVYDVRDPAHPRMSGSYDIPCYNVVVSGGRVYVGTPGGVRVMDASDPTHLVEIGHYATLGRASVLEVIGSYAYLGDGGSVRLLDIADPTNPVTAGLYAPPAVPTSVIVAGDYAYVADSAWTDIFSRFFHTGLAIEDVRDPTNPTDVGFFPTPEAVQGITLVGQYVYAAAGQSGMWIVDVHDPARPAKAGAFDTPEYAWDVAVAGRYAYVADGQSGLRVVDVGVPSKPVGVGIYGSFGNIHSVEVVGQYAYLADNTRGLLVVNVANPARPVEIGVWSMAGAQDVAILGSYAYIAAGTDDLRVIDIADPAHPVEVGHIDMAGGARSITIVGDRAYVASGASLLVFDLTTLAQPVQVGIYAGPLYYGADQTQALHVGVSGDYVYVGGANDGLFVLQQPIAARLTPTNGATLIYTDSHGLATTIQASPGAVISDTTLLYASVSKFASPPGLAWGGRVFDLTAKQGSAPQPGLTFSTPITLTMRYSDADVRAVSDEGKLTLRWWNGGAWVDAVGTCVRASAYHRDTTSNTIGVPICRVGRYALFGPTHQVVLPRVIWNPT